MSQQESIVIDVSGYVHEQEAEDLKKRLLAINFTGVKTVTIDFRNLSFMGSAAIGKLLIFYRKATSHSVKITLANLPEPFFSMFIDMKLDSLFNITKLSGN